MRSDAGFRKQRVRFEAQAHRDHSRSHDRTAKILVWCVNLWFFIVL